VALADALLILARSWPELRERLAPDQVDAVRRELAAAAHGAPWDPAILLGTALSDEPAEHPAWTALAASTERRTSVEAVPVVAAAMALRLVIEGSVQVRSGDPDAIEQAAEARVLLVPMLTLEPTEPRDVPADVLVVPHHGHLEAPRFQFDDEGGVLPPVSEVNRSLDAADDPWGVASWWLSPHAGLHAIPADAVRTDSADDVVAAAAAAGDLR
jgi:hypothetical protein